VREKGGGEMFKKKEMDIKGENKKNRVPEEFMHWQISAVEFLKRV
jgi:hypothetical protein